MFFMGAMTIKVPGLTAMLLTNVPAPIRGY
jgi:hypothetical protein